MPRIHRPRTGRHISPLFALLLLAAAHVARDAGGDPPCGECDLGIALALMGRPAAAESVFTSLLSHTPGDPRAFTNLGNLALLSGEAELALHFYTRARDADSTDAGIVLNEATALLLLGEEDLATARAAEGVRGAGSVRAAAGLLGLPYREAGWDAPRAADRAYLGKDEMLDLLRAAAGKVPTDSTGAGSDTSGARRGQRSPVWRSAGARAGVTPDAATLVYWKR